MTKNKENTENNYKPITRQQISELTAIYKDYLYFVRQYEYISSPKFSKLNLANIHSGKPLRSRKFDFPWNIRLLSPQERQHFDDFVHEGIRHNTGKAYITLQRTSREENEKGSLYYVPQSYNVNMMNMPLPSEIERYVIVSPSDAKIGETEFFIDGKYKAVYMRPEKSEIPVADCLNDMQVCAEFRILINMLEMLLNKNIDPNRRCLGLVLEIFAAENTAVFENNILEILGSFAEKLQKVCRKRYKVTDGNEAFELAQKEGLINSAENFHDYVNIRNLIRHQWDSMDELGYFNAKGAQQNLAARNRYLKSYLKLCDKTRVQRKKSYIDVLHQMQYIIYKLNSNWMIRDNSETKNHFISCVKEFHKQNPKRLMVVELNYSFDNPDYEKLNANLRKVIPQIEVIDDFSQREEELIQQEYDYRLRMWFLQKYHSLECQMMSYCIMSGCDMKNREAWNYIEKKGIISEQEISTWQNYANLRNMLSHNYFDKNLRKQLHDVEEVYFNDVDALGKKLYDVSPYTRWIQKGIYEYVHQDGVVVRLDFNKREITLSSDKSDSELHVKIKGKLDNFYRIYTEKANTCGQEAQIQPEVYPNGTEIVAENEKISNIKLPNGVKINLDKQRVIWDSSISLHTNAKNFNVLQTANHKIIMDKNFHVTEFMEKNRSQPICGGDTFLVDYHHLATIDKDGCLQEFKYKNANGRVISANFKITEGESPMILLSGGTCISFQHGNVKIMHGSKVLGYQNRQAFDASYAEKTTLPPQFSKER